MAAEDKKRVLNLEEAVRAKVQVDKTLKFNTKLKTPDFLKDAKDNRSVININDISSNDVPHTIPSTPKKYKRS